MQIICNPQTWNDVRGRAELAYYQCANRKTTMRNQHYIKIVKFLIQHKKMRYNLTKNDLQQLESTINGEIDEDSNSRDDFD